ncbi:MULTISPECIES: hypothetical protein [unclassified Clostridium]|uniref:DUF7018 domain-containing (lipo)protein n=1 Tax=unclassified Clostridium TaxID=2614128 RepID=UPI0011065B4F|nr:MULTISPECIES: hypothetical protein [unclassified Clostridium]
MKTKTLICALLCALLAATLMLGGCAAPAPEATPSPSATPEATATPSATATPQASASSAAGDDESSLLSYINDMTAKANALSTSMTDVGKAFQNLADADEAWAEDILDKIETCKKDCENFKNMQAPAIFEETQKLYSQAAEQFIAALDQYRDGINDYMSSKDVNKLVDYVTQANDLLLDGSQTMQEGAQAMQDAVK